MDVSHLSSQVSNMIGQLHSLFDEIGIPSHERETRESEFFAAISENLKSHVRRVTVEKHNMVEEAQHIIKTIKQMETSLQNKKPSTDSEDDNFKITFPLIQCLKDLKKKHHQISKLHMERFEEVKKLVNTLESYSSHLEPSFVKISLPPTSSNASIPSTFDLSPSYISSLEQEINRVHEEYVKRTSTVTTLCENMIHLWAELGTPQAQTDRKIVEHYRDSPEKLGLHEDDIARLRAKRDRLVDEKKKRESHLKDLSKTVESLWDMLGIEDGHRRMFLNSNRGCGIRQINEFEDELSRLNELKRQNLHLFVEDARFKLQELWDALYFSEEEMLEFTPAFSDVYSDALLEAHEQEISKLKALKEQRAPTLALIEKHRSLVKDREELQASSQDASRLLGRGQKGEKRDPTRLLREEKMRKRISKDLPKICVELRKSLEKWENEYGRPFLVHGERYLDSLEDTKPTLGPRSKTPTCTTISKNQKPGISTQPNSAIKTPLLSGSLRVGSKTPVSSKTLNKTLSRCTTTSLKIKSPTKIPTRPPLSNIYDDNSPERKFMSNITQEHASFKTGSIFQISPPKMRDVHFPPPSMMNSSYRVESVNSCSNVRQVTSDDMFHDGYFYEEPKPTRLQSNYDFKASMRQNEVGSPDTFTSRQTSITSNTMTSGSENWQTIEDDSEPELESTDAYLNKFGASHGKRFNPEDYAQSFQTKKQRGLISSTGSRPGFIGVCGETN